jgi:hypothetical protein
VSHSRLAGLAHDVAPFIEKRTRRRRRVLLAGKLAFGMVASDCTIRDLTEVGAKVLAPTVAGVPDEVFLLIMREGLVVRARRVWSKPPLFGLKFLEAEDVETSAKPQAAPLRRIWSEWVSQQRG